MGEHYDLIVIGGGPGGYTSAIAAAKEGLKVALFEKAKLGGACLNVGCIPTKYLLDKASMIEKIRMLTEKEVFKEAGSFSFKKIQEGKSEVVTKLVNGIHYLLKRSKVEVVFGEAQLKRGKKVICEGKEYSAAHVIIAAGSMPASLPVPGAEHTISSTGALNLARPPERLLVIGGGIIGLELASAFASYGSEVTVVERMDTLLPSEQPQLVNMLRTALTRRGIKIITGAAVEQIEKRGTTLSVVYQHEGKTETALADTVLMAVGRKANVSCCNPSELGLKLDGKGFIEVDEYMRTNLDGIYAIGDAAGGYQLAHAAYAEGHAAVSSIMGANKKADLEPMPRCVYTMPSFAAVGMTAAQAEEAGLEAAIGTFHYDVNGMALAEGASGSVYVVMDKRSHKTLGVHIVGEQACELIALATAAISTRMTVDDWERLVVAHPSLSEMVREAALDAFGKSTHK
jgi:dihydrolipoamide dehydrogenase